MRRIITGGLAFLVGTQLVDFVLLFFGQFSFQILGFLAKLLLIAVAGVCVSLLLTRFKSSRSQVSLLELWFFLTFGMAATENFDLGVTNGSVLNNLAICTGIAILAVIVLVVRQFKTNSVTVGLANFVLFAGGWVMYLFSYSNVTIVRWFFLVITSVVLLGVVGVWYTFTQIREVWNLTPQPVQQRKQGQTASTPTPPSGFTASRRALKAGETEIPEHIPARTVAQVDQKFTVYTIETEEAYTYVKEQLIEKHYGWAIVEFGSERPYEVWIEGKQLQGSYPNLIEARNTVKKVLSGEIPFRFRFYRVPDDGKNS